MSPEVEYRRWLAERDTYAIAVATPDWAVQYVWVSIPVAQGKKKVPRLGFWFTPREEAMEFASLEVAEAVAERIFKLLPSVTDGCWDGAVYLIVKLPQGHRTALQPDNPWPWLPR